MKKIKELKELNKENVGGFTIVIDEEKNSLAVTGRFNKGDTIVYVNDLNNVNDIKHDLSIFGFNFEIIKEFKILFDKKHLKVLMTSNGYSDRAFEFFVKMIEKKLNKKMSFDDILEYFKDDKNYKVIIVEI